MFHSITNNNNIESTSKNGGGDRLWNWPVRQNYQVACHVAGTWSMISDILCMFPGEMIFHYPETSSDPLHDCPLQIQGLFNLLSESPLGQICRIINHKRKRKWKIWPTKFTYCPIVSQSTTFNLPLTMAEEIDLQIGHFRIFRGSVTLTLTRMTLKVISSWMASRPLPISPIGL